MYLFSHTLYLINLVTFAWVNLLWKCIATKIWHFNLNQWDSKKMACVPSEDSDQPGHAPSLIRVFSVCWMGSFLHADSEDSDQTGRMPRLIWVFAGCTCHFVAIIMMQLISAGWSSNYKLMKSQLQAKKAAVIQSKVGFQHSFLCVLCDYMKLQSFTKFTEKIKKTIRWWHQPWISTKKFKQLSQNPLQML